MYLSYKDFAVDFNLEDLSFEFISSTLENKVFLRSTGMTFETLDRRELSRDEYKTHRIESKMEFAGCVWNVIYSDGPATAPTLRIGFKLDDDGIEFHVGGRFFVRLEGDMLWGGNPEENTFSVRTGSCSSVLHCSSGPAAREGDNALFDRQSDRLLSCTTAGRMKTFFNWQKKCYSFTYTNGIDYGRELKFSLHENYCREKFRIPYKPVNLRHCFTTPPVGWMTWYALQFDTCEETVLHNADRFMALFGKYTPRPVFWVDWEWCHKSWDGLGIEGCDIFHPRKDIYPEGLAAVAEKLEKMGFVPALWISASNDGQLNEMFKAHPDWLLGQSVKWCGQWWIDPSHPEVLREFIPAVFRQIRQWGFAAVKWDCLPDTLQTCDELHEKFYDPGLTPLAAFRNMISAARETLGEDIYMLSCWGASRRDICAAMDIFDAARIGGDIFSWEAFLAQGIDRILACYPWHNTVFYADADNLILRPELNNDAQARSRAAIYSLAGLPLTMGDAIDDLDELRIDLLRRIMPVISVHPGELEAKTRDLYCQVVNLAVSRPFGSWNVAGVTNLTDKPLTREFSLRRDLALPAGRYAVYNFYEKRFAGVFADTLSLEIAPSPMLTLP